MMARFLSEHDYDRIQQMLHWWDQNKTRVGQQRRRYPISSVTSDGVKIAYCKVNAGDGNTIDCFLNVDTTGNSISVHCSLPPGVFNLSDCVPLLKEGMFMGVIYDSIAEQWKSLIPFDKFCVSDATCSE